MLVKVFPRRSSADKSGRGAIDYALGDRNHEGDLREQPAELLRGDPEITNAVIESGLKSSLNAVKSTLKNDIASL